VSITLHAAHGFRANGTPDSGAVGPTGLQEHQVMRDLVQRVGHLLRAQHVTVTEYLDTPSINPVREANARADDLILFLHANAANGKAHGAEVWYRGEYGRKVAQAIQARLVAYFADNKGWFTKSYAVADRGIKEAVYPGSRAGNVMHSCHMDAVLVEALFIDNPLEEALLRDPRALEEIAQAIADGIMAAAKGER